MSENLELNKNKEQQLTIQRIEESFKEPIQIENPYAHKMMEDVTHNKESIREKLLDEKIDLTMSFMPKTRPLKKKEKKKKETGNGIDGFPGSLQKAISTIAGWGKTKAVSSGPVKEAAMALQEAKTDEQASKCLGELLSASIKYLDMRVDQWHIWFGTGWRRLRHVRNFIEQAYLFSANAPSVYAEALDSCMDGFLRTSVEAPERYQRHVETAQFMRDTKTISSKSRTSYNKKSESDTGESAEAETKVKEHIKAEINLTEKEFDRITDRLGEDAGYFAGKLKFDSESEAIENKEKNARFLSKMKKDGHQFLRGLALGMNISSLTLATAKANLRMADYLLEHLEESNDIYELRDRFMKEVQEEIDSEVNKVNKLYGLSYSYSILYTDEKSQLEYFTKNGDIDAFKQSPEYPKFAEKFKGRPQPVEYFIVKELCVRYGNTHDPRAFRSEINMDDDEMTEAFISLERRKAKGTLFKEVEASTARAAMSFKKSMDDATQDNDYETIGRMAKSIISIDLSSLMNEYIKQPALISARVAEIKTTKDYLPYITANRERCELSPDQLSRLLAFTTIIDKIDKRMSLEKNLFTKGNYFNDEDSFDSDKLDRLRKYGKFAVDNNDKDISEEAQNILEYVDNAYIKLGAVDPDEELDKTVIIKEDEIMEQGMKETDTLIGFTGHALSYNPEEMEAKRQLRVSHIDNMLEILNTYKEHEEERDIESKRYKKITQRIEELQKQRDYLTNEFTYENGVDEAFTHDDIALDNVLKDIQSHFAITGTSNEYYLNRSEFDKRKAKASAAISEIIAKCEAQLSVLKDSSDETLKKKLSDMNAKRKAQFDAINNLSYDRFLVDYKNAFLGDFLQIASMDEARKALMEDQAQKSSSLQSEFGQIKAEYLKTIPKGYEKIGKIHSDYVAEKTKSSKTVAKIPQLEKDILAGTVVLDEAYLDVLMSDIYSDITIEDVKHQSVVGGFMIASFSNDLKLGAEDTSTVMDFAQKFFTDNEFAAKMGLKEEHMEEYKTLSAMTDELQIIATKQMLMENILPMRLNIDTKNLPEAQKESIEKQKKIYSTHIRNMEYSLGKLSDEKFQVFCDKFFTFIMDNNLGTTMAKDDGKEKDYFKEIEEFESVIDTKDMNEKEILTAKINLLENGLKGKYPDPSEFPEEKAKIVKNILGFDNKGYTKPSVLAFAALMKWKYYNKQLNKANTEK